MSHSDSLTATILEFIRSIGLEVRLTTIDGETFLPGITVQQGAMVVDEARLLYPGDLLHEAGHLALMSGLDRRAGSGKLGDDGGAEMGAIAWSFAAATHLGLDASVVFHEYGYKGDGPWLAETFRRGSYIGLPMLEWLGLAARQEAIEQGAPPYPQLVHWLRE